MKITNHVSVHITDRSERYGKFTLTTAMHANIIKAKSYLYQVDTCALLLQANQFVENSISLPNNAPVKMAEYIPSNMHKVHRMLCLISDVNVSITPNCLGIH